MSEYSTSDTAVAAALVVSGLPVVSLGQEKRGKVLFNFDDTDELKQTMNDFWGHKLMVDPLAYSQQLKQLKGRVHDSQRNL